MINFKNFLNINLKNYKFLSDQGPALKGLYKDYSIKHCFCLHHVLVNLKYNQFSYAVNEIIKCSTEFELKNALNYYSKKLSEINPNDSQNRDKLLKKVGLIFSNNKIEIGNEEKWSKFSMCRRVGLKLPSTTNSLEATHGQLNAKTPRKKNFWNTLYKIASNLNNKNNTIQSHIQHNFYYEKKKTLNHYNRIKNTRILDEILHYGSTIDECPCSENKILSALYNTDIPCCHRIHLGCEFPECPKAGISISRDCNTLIDDYKILDDETQTDQNSIQVQDKLYAIQMIKRFGKQKDSTKITQFVDKYYTLKNNDIYILIQYRAL